jgi:hypothetical protein
MTTLARCALFGRDGRNRFQEELAALPVKGEGSAYGDSASISVFFLLQKIAMRASEGVSDLIVWAINNFKGHFISCKKGTNCLCFRYDRISLKHRLGAGWRR